MARRSTAQDLAGSLTNEVVALCRKGLRHGNPPPAPALRRLLQIPKELPAPQALPLLRASLVEAAAVLPLSHRRVFYEASGARAGSPLGREERLEVAAKAERISVRTARRWSEEVAPPQIVAQLLNYTDRIVHNASFAVTRLHARLDLSVPNPVVALERTIHVLAPQLESFYEEVSLPGPRKSAPMWHGLGGCRVEQVRELSQDMWAVRYRFKHPLRMNDSHTFSICMRLDDHESLHPELAFRPHNTTLNVSISIRFGDRLPSRIETFKTTGTPGGVPPSHITRTLAPESPLQRFEFKEIHLGFAVGVRWR